MVPEEQDVHADDDGYHREHVKHDGCLSSHRLFLLCATEWNKSGALDARGAVVDARRLERAIRGEHEGVSAAHAEPDHPHANAVA